jgi:glycosyltransferase involved in cell wall biosynthesis
LTCFSVILAVRNGWPYVQQCVESVLAQTHTDLDLIVLDNQSTDNTVPWLKTLEDKRIRLFSSQAPLSIVESWARAKDVDKQQYMTLIGHDDMLDPDFLMTLKTLIDRYPDSALYQTGARFINADGKIIRSCKAVPEVETAAQYLEARLTSRRDIFGTGFVMRSADYDRLGGIPSFEKLFFADDALWLSLLAGSNKAANPADHFSVRIHPGSESASSPSIWQPAIIGLNQFADFLNRYLPGNVEAAAVYNRYGAEFMLSRHRSFFMYALVEACQQRRKISPDVVERFEKSLTRTAPALAGALRRSPTVAAISLLNSSPLRAMVPSLWKLYNGLKGGSQ